MLILSKNKGLIFVDRNGLKIYTRNLNLFYGDVHALKDVCLDIEEKKVTALIGPSGCRRSTFLKTLNRMNAD